MKPRGALRKMLVRRTSFPGTARYWDSRYVRDGTSGAGSYGRLAEFKAVVVNELIVLHDLVSAVEWGCGDGAQLGAFSFQRYLGVDVSSAAVRICRQRYVEDPSKKFVTLKEVGQIKAHCALSLDVIYHLVEDHVFDEYMQRLFQSAERLVVIYSSNFEDMNTPDHMRHRRFSDWIDHNVDGWRLQRHVANPYPWDPSRQDITSFADFYIYEPSRPFHSVVGDPVADAW